MNTPTGKRKQIAKFGLGASFMSALLLMLMSAIPPITRAAAPDDAEYALQATATFTATATPVPALQAYIYGSEWDLSGSGNGSPWGIVFSGSMIYITDRVDDRVQVFNSNGIFVREWGTTGSGAGQFNQPHGIAVDGNGNIYVVDTKNNRIQKFDTNGNFITAWGSLGTAVGEFNQPYGIAIDGNDNVYVVDRNNHRVQKFDSSGNLVIGGNWPVGTAGSNNSETIFPDNVAVDTAGDVYVLDQLNHRVQKFDSDGNFIISWGSYGSSAGQFDTPQGIVVSSNGLVFVADTGNNRVQFFTNSGTFLGTWGSGGNGAGQFSNPTGVTVDGSGNVYVVDNSNQRLQKFLITPFTPTPTNTATPTMTYTPSATNTPLPPTATRTPTVTRTSPPATVGPTRTPYLLTRTAIANLTLTVVYPLTQTEAARLTSLAPTLTPTITLTPSRTPLVIPSATASRTPLPTATTPRRWPPTPIRPQTDTPTPGPTSRFTSTPTLQEGSGGGGDISVTAETIFLEIPPTPLLTGLSYPVGRLGGDFGNTIAFARVPAGAVSDETGFIIRANDDPEYGGVSGNFRMVRPVADVLANTGQTDFDPALTVCLAYNEEDLTDVGGDVADLHVGRHDGVEWVPLTQTTSLRDGFVCGTSSKLGHFSLVTDAPRVLLTEETRSTLTPLLVGGCVGLPLLAGLGAVIYWVVTRRRKKADEEELVELDPYEVEELDAYEGEEGDIYDLYE